MIKATIIFQLDSSVTTKTIKNTTTEELEEVLLSEGFVFNKITEYWEKDNEMVLLQEVEG